MGKPVQEYTQAIIVKLLIECIDEFSDGKISRDNLNKRINEILEKSNNWWIFEHTGEYRLYVSQRLGKRRIQYLKEIIGSPNEKKQT